VTCPHCGQPDVMPWRLWWVSAELNVCPTCFCHAYETYARQESASVAPTPQRVCGKCLEALTPEDAPYKRHVACRASERQRYHTQQRRRRLRMLKAG
jgi:hypothetical protein